MSSVNKNDTNRSEFLSSRAIFFGRLIRWARVVSLTRKLSIALAAAAIVSGIATYGAMTGSAPFGSNASNVLILLNIDLVLLLLLGAVVAVRLVRLWLERRRGSAGSQLHSRLVALFSLVSVTPAIVVAIFSALFLNFGLQAWFSKQHSKSTSISPWEKTWPRNAQAPARNPKPIATTSTCSCTQQHQS